MASEIDAKSFGTFDEQKSRKKSQESRNVSGLFRVPQFFATPRFYVIKICSPLGFSCIKNMFKNHLFKTSGLQFHNWGPFRARKVFGTLEKQAPGPR